MASSILITGGCRSGKTAYAMQLARGYGGPLVYIATSPRSSDPEMLRRIKAHQAERASSAWQTIEEERDLCAAVRQCPAGATVLIDCLTLWLSNSMYYAEKEGLLMDESNVVQACEQLYRAINLHSGVVLMVTNEVGLGIVPDNPVARRFRDLAGRCNQHIARCAEQVILMSCGLPLRLKG
ncbi:MAG: bifunctional adenosylcobinamide kinase/adenosylcobinamide-phosphate guanylyltransferase [Desulfobulbus propionicus]|nr:MAG: bifunctional adenosylcobinamide kinase/adenosylcobinamide-phosphate guanylyltransferase [Desulfobulbus propionicus]